MREIKNWVSWQKLKFQWWINPLDRLWSVGKFVHIPHLKWQIQAWVLLGCTWMKRRAFQVLRWWKAALFTFYLVVLSWNGGNGMYYLDVLGQNGGRFNFRQWWKLRGISLFQSLPCCTLSDWGIFQTFPWCSLMKSGFFPVFLLDVAWQNRFFCYT